MAAKNNLFSGARRRLSRSLARLERHLARRPDSEHELIRPRLTVGTAVITAFVGSSIYSGLNVDDLVAPFGVFVAHLGVASAVFAHLLHHPAPSPVRRVIGSGNDIVAASLFTWAAGTGAAVAFPIYVWVTLGAGLRFGRRDLFVTAAISTIAFNTFGYVGGTWTNKPTLALALTAGLLIVPIYLASHIKRLADAKIRAEAENRASNMLLLRMRQEVNASLDALAGLGDGLGDHMPPSEQARHARAILDAGQALMSMVGATLEPTPEISAQDAETTVDVHALLEGLRSLLGLRGRAQSVAVAVHVDAAVPRRARLAKSVVDQALLTLGTHIVGTSRGADVIIEASVVHERDQSFLRVAFTEPSAPAGARRNIFADRPGRRRATGPATARRLVLAHGGRVGVEVVGSEVTTFIEMPAHAEPAAATGGDRRKILLVSADPSLLDMLRATGSNVTACAQIDEAVRLVGTGWARGSLPLLVADSRLTGFDLAPLAHACRYGADVHCVLLCEPGAPALGAIERMHCYASLRLPLEADALAPFLPAIPGRSTKSDVAGPVASADPTGPLVVQVAIRDRLVERLVVHVLGAAGHVCRTLDGKSAGDLTLASGHDVAVVDEALLDGQSGPLPRVVALVAPDSRLQIAVAGKITRPIDPTLLVGLVSTAAFGVPAIATKPAALPQPAPPAETAADAEESATAKAVPVDFRSLGDLEKLGGREFVDDIVRQFLGDGQQILGELEAAAVARDEEAFRDLAHALRSCAANVGAQALYKLLLSWRVIERAELEAEGAAHMQSVRQAWDAARVILEKWLARADETAPAGDVAEAA